VSFGITKRWPELQIGQIVTIYYTAKENIIGIWSEDTLIIDDIEIK